MAPNGGRTMRTMLVLLVAALALAAPGAAAAADTLPFSVHATVSFEAPTANCPVGKASIPMQVVTTGELTTATACVTAVSPCGDACLRANIRYTFPLAAGKVVVQVAQEQTIDALGSVAGVT